MTNQVVEHPLHVPRPTDEEMRAKAQGSGMKPVYNFGFAHIVAIFNYFPRMADGFGLKPDPKLLEAAETGIPLQRAT